MRRFKLRALGALLLGSSALVGRESIGWALGKMLDHAQWAQLMTILTSIQWQDAFSLLLFLAAVVLLVWPAKRQPKKIELLARDAQAWLHRFDRSKGGRLGSWERRRSESFDALSRDAMSLLLSFSKNRFSVPDMFPEECEGRCEVAAEYFSAVVPLIRDGHTREAFKLSATIAAQAVKN